MALRILLHDDICQYLLKHWASVTSKARKEFEEENQRGRRRRKREMRRRRRRETRRSERKTERRGGVGRGEDEEK